MDNGCGQQQAPVRSWDAVASFDSITYMNHDANPARADPQRRVLQDWLELAAKVSLKCPCLPGFILHPALLLVTCTSGSPGLGM
jgi:hypothetical protein